VSAKSEVAAVAEVAPAPAKSKKMLVLVLAGVVILALAAGGAMFFVNKKNAALEEDDDEEVVSAPTHDKPHGPPTYLPLDNMVVNLADPGGEKVAQVGVTLELSDVMAMEKVKPYMPAIRSGILLLISQRTAEEMLQREGKDKLAADILTEASRHFGTVPATERKEVVQAKSKKKKAAAKPVEAENPVRGVLFSSFIVQ
jgi:flagellar FliL protein